MNMLTDDPSIFRLLLDSTADWETFTDAEGVVRYSSPQCTQVLGMDLGPGPVELDEYVRRVHPGDAAMVREHWTVVHGGLESGEMTYRFMNPDGTHRWIAHACSPVFDAAGRFIGTRGSNRDVTKSKRTEEQLAERLAAQHAIMAIASELLTIPLSDIDKGIDHALELIGANLAADSVSIQVKDEKLDVLRTVNQWIAEEYQERKVVTTRPVTPTWFPWLGAQLIQGKSIIWNTLDDIPEIAAYERMEMPRQGVASMMVTPVLREGRVIAAIGVASFSGERQWTGESLAVLKTIADLIGGFMFRREVEDRMREMELRWRYAVEGGGEGMWDLHAPTGEIWISERYAEILGYERTELVPTTALLRSRVHPDDQGRLEAVIGELLGDSSGAPRRFQEDIRMLTSEGRWKWVSCRGATMEHGADGRAVRLIGTLRDITLRKGYEMQIIQQSEELREALVSMEEALRAKDVFLATMHHELRTPLTSIQSAAEILEMQRELLTDRQLHFVRMIKGDGQRLLAIINDVLEYTRIESGTMELDIHPIMIEPVLTAVFGEMHDRAQAAGLTLVMRSDGDALMVHADPERLRQMLVQLLDNAIKFTDAGGSVLLRAAPDADPNRVCVDVVDTGCGIRREDLSKLFMPFVLLDDRLERMKGGTGLGLVICKRLAELQEGAISVESAPGTGSTFRVTLRRVFMS